MKATITKIDYMRKGTDESYYQAVYFRLDGGESAKTHLCKAMRNFSRWKPLLKVGAILTNLKFKRDGLIDADSFPSRVKVLETPPLL